MRGRRLAYVEASASSSRRSAARDGRQRLLFERVREPLARFVGLALARPQARIEAAFGQQLEMLALLDDLAAIEHDDVVGMHDGGEAMRDDEARALARHAFERVLDLALGMAVERRGRLVEHQDRRRLQDGAGDRHALLLAAGEFQAALADQRVVALRQRHDEVVDLGEPRRLAHLGLARIGFAVADVVFDRVVEQHGILRHHADRRPERGLRHVA